MLTTTEPRTSSRRWVWLTFRALVSVLTIDAYLQAVLAGRFLSGAYGSLLMHRSNGVSGVAILSFALVVVSIVAWRTKQATGTLVVLTVLLSGVIALQIMLGFERILGLHIPLGVAIIALSTVLTIWAWRR
ncbi:hypothetical protein [Actinocrispum wychmicini]|nr:hypothetical protein [Actinocrispum wychmicini]